MIKHFTRFLLILLSLCALSVSADPGPAEVEAFIDGMALSAMENDQLAGAVVTIVKDNQILVSKAYGYADFEAKRMASSESSPFRVASVTKLFTWTAIMQLAEQGKIALDSDINSYLDFEIPLKFDTPITIRHLLGHTGGFEDAYFGFNEKDRERIPSLEEWIKSHQLKQVRPAGEYSAYSNYGAALAAYIIQRVSGQDFADYIKTAILDPLGMENTSLAQPFPNHIENSLVAGHIPMGDQFITDSGYFMPSLGGGSLAATGLDMAAFMLAHLNHGTYNGSQILTPETTALMHSTLFKNHPEVNGMAHGFYEASSHGLRIIAHGGDIDYHHSDLALIPDKNLGIFVSINSNTGMAFRDNFVRLFLNRFFHDSNMSKHSESDVEKIDLSRYTGIYRSNRRGYTNIMKLAALTMPIKVTQNNGALEMNSVMGPPVTLYPVTEHYFSDRNGRENIGFHFDEKGRVTALAMDTVSTMIFEKTDLFSNPDLHYKILILMIVVLIIFLLIRLTGFCYRKYYKIHQLQQTSSQKRLNALNIGNSILIILLSTGLILILSAFSYLYGAGELPVFAFILTFPLIILAVAVMQTFFLIKDWRKLKLLEKLQYGLTTGCSVWFIWFCFVYNLIGYNLL